MRSVKPAIAGQGEKKRQPRGDFRRLIAFSISSFPASVLISSIVPDMDVRGCPYRAMAFYQSYRFKSNLTFSHGVIARPGHPRTDCIFWNGGCVSVSLAFGASRGKRLYFLLGRVRSACRHYVPFAKRPLLAKNLHRQACPLDTLEFPVLRLPRRKRLREMDNLSDPLSACDLSTGNRALSFVHLPSFSLSASAI